MEGITSNAEIHLEITTNGFGTSQHSLKQIISQTSIDKEISGSGSGVGSKRKIERYKKIEQLSHGAFGTVFKAEDTQKNNLIVALKRIICSNLDEANDSFQEVLVIKDLDHIGLVKYHDLFMEPLPDNTVGVCFIMDLFTEGDLGKYLFKRKKRNKYIPMDVNIIIIFT